MRDDWRAERTGGRNRNRFRDEGRRDRHLAFAAALTVAAALPLDGALAASQDTFASVVDALGSAARHARVWAHAGLERTPALAFGIVAMLALLPLTLTGLLLRPARWDETTVTLRHGRDGGRDANGDQRAGDELGRGFATAPWPSDGWIDIVTGAAPARYEVGRRTLVRIGRGDDNDALIDAPSIHRNHAVIGQTDEGVFGIWDLSGPDGNGVMVNGRRIVDAELADGDRVSLGEVGLVFRLKPA